jgi:hypothetical protein
MRRASSGNTRETIKTPPNAALHPAASMNVNLVSAEFLIASPFCWCSYKKGKPPQWAAFLLLGGPAPFGANALLTVVSFLFCRMLTPEILIEKMTCLKLSAFAF